MSWQDHRLGDLVSLRSGGTPKKSESRYWDGKIPWLSSKDLTTPRIHDAPLHVTEEGVAHGTRLMPENTVMFVVRGMSLASEFRVSITKRPCAFNQDLKAAECNGQILPDFLFYSLFARREHIRALAGEASHGTKKLETYIVENIRLRVPNLRTQEHVIEIASTYDDLIENNRRRIALLEEAARLLYREWFVHFRFPGRERVKIIDGIPEGWERCEVGSILEFQYGKALKESDRMAGAIPVFGSSGIVGSHQAALVEGPVIIVGRKGNVGSIYWSPVNCWPIDTVYFVPRERVDLWLYMALPSAGFQNTDAGVPGLNRNFAYSRKLLRPSKHVRRLFNEFVGPMFSQRTTLEKYNQELAQARDLLLPRLMSGEVAE